MTMVLFVFNPFKANGLAYPYQCGKSISNVRGFFYQMLIQ